MLQCYSILKRSIPIDSHIDKLEIDRNDPVCRTKMPYTRESLLAEWKEIHPSEPMPIELQNLLIMFGSYSAERNVSANQGFQLHQASAPPPQRFQRGMSTPSTAPSGPTEVYIEPSTEYRNRWVSAQHFKSIPSGPKVET